MLVRDVMTKAVIAVAPDASVEDVAQLLVRHRIHGVPVVTDGKLIGMITEGDFFTKGKVTVYLPEYISMFKQKTSFKGLSPEKQSQAQQLFEARARDIMSAPCITIRQDADTDTFFQLVKEQAVNSVPVVDENDKLVGIITLADIISMLHFQEESNSAATVQS